MKRYALAIFLLCIGLTHIPFLLSDPDTQVSLNTRGAWTDEGLHTAQLRDYINHGKLDLYNSNSFIISPVFNLVLFPFFLVFGTDILVARIVSLLFTLAVVFLLATEKKYTLPAALYAMLILSQYHFFQFTHYAMIETFAINFILLAVYALIRFEKHEGKIKTQYIWAVVASFLVFLAYGTKIQFAYIAVVPPVAFLLFALFEPDKDKRTLRFRFFGVSALSTLAFALIYVLVWYLPHSAFYNYILSYETSERFADTISGILTVYRFNFRHLIWVSELKTLLITGAISLLVLVFTIFRKPGNRSISLPLIFAFVWLLVEQHKIAMVYLPTRYFLSLIAATGLFAALSLTALTQNLMKWQVAIFAIVIVLMIFQYSDNYKAYQRRTFDIKAVDAYLRQYDFGSQPVLGIWANTLAAGTKAKTIGVRHDYLNFEDPINNYKPRLIITEFNEAESDNVFSRQGIDLKAISDSMRSFKVWRYDLELYWIKQELINEY
ncbi:MAG: phospholipid carrier-dependent glycosyltransferase [Bacteroidales bacterium]|nr:phospholipid carrier-dependent glycosyltransferase [Bacteroidales bacterium]